MPKSAVSVTIEDSNLLWLKSRTLARKGRSLSETLDDLVTAARTGAPGQEAIRSVSGTVDIADDDPNLDRADDYIRELVESSTSMPFLVRERPPADVAGRSRKKAPRG